MLSYNIIKENRSTSLTFFRTNLIYLSTVYNTVLHTFNPIEYSMTMDTRWC